MHGQEGNLLTQVGIWIRLDIIYSPAYILMMVLQPQRTEKIRLSDNVHVFREKSFPFIYTSRQVIIPSII